MASAPVSPALLSDFTEIIDVRTPAEFAEDHIPGAINLPVLDNEERVTVGTLHKQVSPFAARKVGAALVSRHIANYLENHFQAKPIRYKPLVYCWRGGNRSGSMTHVLKKVGFQATQLEGGYKSYRRSVIADLEVLPAQFTFRVICGPTGCGKSRLLKTLAERGAQVLDLEDLAAHRGSLLGNVPGKPQPSQKMLESQIWWQLTHFDPSSPVYLESESKKIGNLQIPDALMTAMHSGQSIWLESSLDQRVELLLEEYDHYLHEPAMLLKQIEHLIPLRGHQQVECWKGMIVAENWQTFVRDMLHTHYDPAYLKSLGRNYGASSALTSVQLRGVQSEDFALAAEQIEEMHAVKNGV